MGVKGIVVGRNTKPAATYSVASNSYSPNEGDTITFTITTTNVADGTTIYWWIREGSISAADFVENTNNGSVTISDNSASFTLTLKNDFVTEGSETFAIGIGLSSYGTLLAYSSTVTVGDTSLTIPAGNQGILSYGSLTFTGEASMFYADSNTFATGTADAVPNTSGNGDFTFEAWVWVDGQHTTAEIFSLGPYSGADTPEGSRFTPVLTLSMYNGAVTLRAQGGDADWVITGTWPAFDEWIWVAVSRVNGNVRLFLNGYKTGATQASAANYNDGRLYLGGESNLKSQYALYGYMTDIRYSVGTGLGLYGEDITYFHPVEALPIITGTKLKLTVASSGSRIANSQSITMVETGSAHSFSSKYPLLVPYLWFNGTNSSAGVTTGIWADLGSSGKHAVLYNSPPFVSSENGGFIRFNALNSQYAQGPYLGSVDFFTINMWVRINSWPPSSGGGYGCFFTDIYTGHYVCGTIGHNVNGNGYGSIRAGFFSDSQWNLSGAGITPTIGTWQMLTLTVGDNNDGNRAVKFYLNGTLVDSSYQNHATNSDAVGYRLARKWDSDDYLSIDIGSIQYFKYGLPASSVTTIWNLTNNTYNRTRSYNWPASNSQYLIISGAPITWNMGSTWTIQWWSHAAQSSNLGAMSVLCQESGSGISIVYYNGSISIGGDYVNRYIEPTPNVWTHVAIVNNAGTVKVYYNGVEQINQGTGGDYVLGNGTDPLYIGKRGTIGDQYFYGELTGIRIQPYALYTAPFNPFSEIGGYHINDILSLWPTDQQPTLDLRGHTVTAYNYLGLNAYIPSITPLEAVQAGGNPITSGYFAVGAANVRVQSSNFNGTRGSFIEVNGVQIASSVEIGVGNLMTTGHTVAIINPVTGTANVTTYDTYNGSTSSMVSDLNNVDPTSIVAIASYDATRKDTNLNTALAQFGSNRTDTWTQSRVSHYFVGIIRDTTLGYY